MRLIRNADEEPKAFNKHLRFERDFGGAILGGLRLCQKGGFVERLGRSSMPEATEYQREQGLLKDNLRHKFVT